MRIIEDTRKIRALAFYDQDGSCWFIGSGSDVTKIIPYAEKGELGLVTWFKVFEGNFLRARVPARMVEVNYFEENES